MRTFITRTNFRGHFSAKFWTVSSCYAFLLKSFVPFTVLSILKCFGRVPFRLPLTISMCCRYTNCNLKQKQGSNILLAITRKWFLFIHIVPDNIVDFCRASEISPGRGAAKFTYIREIPRNWQKHVKYREIR